MCRVGYDLDEEWFRVMTCGANVCVYDDGSAYIPMHKSK